MLSSELEIAVAKETNRTVSPTARQETFFKPKGHPYRNTVRVIKGLDMTTWVSRDSVTKSSWVAQQPKGSLLWRIPLPIFRNLPPPDCILRFFTEDKIRPQYQVETNLHDRISIFLQCYCPIQHCLYLTSGNGIIKVFMVERVHRTFVYLWRLFFMRNEYLWCQSACTH